MTIAGFPRESAGETEPLVPASFQSGAGEGCQWIGPNESSGGLGPKSSAGFDGTRQSAGNLSDLATGSSLLNTGISRLSMWPDIFRKRSKASAASLALPQWKRM